MSVQLCRWDFMVAIGHDPFTCMPILGSAPARPTRSTFVDLSHDNNSGQTYAINQVTGLSYSTSTYPDLDLNQA